MGFSVSGAAAIIFAGMFIAFGMWYTASANSFERITDAQQDRTERTLSTKNADVEVVTAEHDGSTLTVEVDNAGATQLRLNDTDLLVDGQYVSGWQGNATVQGDGGTDLWLSGERLNISLERSTQPDHVTVVGEAGVSDVAEVTSTV